MSDTFPTDEIRPPPEDGINVLAISTSASALQDLGISAGKRMVTFISDTTFYLTFSKDDTATVTDPNTTATTGGGRTFGPYAKETPWSFVVKPSRTYFKVIAAEDSKYLRWHIE